MAIIMEYVMAGREGFSKTVSLVVVAIDDFTNKPITGSNVRVYIQGASLPIKKPEGYFVFTNLRSGELVVHAEGGLYHSLNTECRLSDDAEGYKFIKIRMLPNRSYPIPEGTSCVEGMAEPHSDITLYSTDKAGAYKLLFDTKAGEDTISIYHTPDVEMEGRLLFITADGEKGDYFRVASLRDGEKLQYSLAEPLRNSYKKIGTSLYAVYETTADQTGRFFLPVKKMYKEKNEFICKAAGTQTVCKKCELEANKVNRLDLTSGR